MITHKGTQNINTERLLLRKIMPDDAEMVYKWMSDLDVVKFEDWDVHENVDYTRGFISYLTGDYKSEDIYCWGMQAGEELVGNMLVAGISEDTQTGMIAYYLRKDCWNKGYATEAVKAVINYMFTDVGLARIDAKHSISNPASGKVLKKAGMYYRGHVKEYYYCHGLWHDCDFYALVKE